MKCDICGDEVTSASFGTIVGLVCKKESCRAIAQAQREAFFKEPWTATDIENAPDLNKSMTRFAYMFIEAIKKDNPKAYARIKSENALMLIPEELQLDITQRVLRVLPKEYIGENRQNRGHARLFCDGVFSLTKTIPAAVLMKALEDAEYLVKES